MTILCWMILVDKFLNQTAKKSLNSWLRQLFISALSICLLVLATACAKGPETVKFSGPMMGTEYKITLLCEGNKKTEAWQVELLPIMESVNQSMSTYIADSELMQFNQSSNTEFQAASEGLLYVFSVAQRVAFETKGALDVTVQPLVELWGFGSNKQKSLTETPNIPTEQELASVSEYIGFEKLKFDGSFSKWRKTHPKVAVDFSAVAKGYAVDLVSNYLIASGCLNHLVDIGGEVKAEGLNPKGKAWRLAIEKPESNNSFQALVDLSGVAVASSGDYRNFHIIDGKRYSHTLDPRTLKPIDHHLAAVTVIDPVTARADALATAFMVMGESAIDFAKEKKIPAMFIFRTPLKAGNEQQEYKVLYSEAFEQYLVSQ